MPRMNAAPTGGGKRVETDSEKLAWKNFRRAILGTVKGKTKLFNGQIVAIKGDPDNPLMPRMADPHPKAKTKDKRAVLDVYAELTDPEFQYTDDKGGRHGLGFKKTVGYSFYDGSGSGGYNAGGMHLLHLAVMRQEPPASYKSGKEGPDTDEYLLKPVLLDIIYQGKVEPDSEYYGQRGNVAAFLQGFEPTEGGPVDDDEDDEEGDGVPSDFDADDEDEEEAESESDDDSDVDELPF